MDICNWMHTGESANGILKVWVKVFEVDGQKYMKVKYTDRWEDKLVGVPQDYSFEQVRLLKALLEVLDMEGIR